MGNNSSLQMMFDCIAQGFTHGYSGCTPWARQEKVKFLCPAPGYDRHFAVTEYFGFEMIPVPMLKTGPDMDIIERLVAQVPKYRVVRVATSDGAEQLIILGHGALRLSASAFRAGVEAVQGQIADALKDRGFDVTETGNTDTYVYDETLVVYNDDAFEAAAETVVASLGLGRTVPGAGFYTFDTDVLVVLGKDWKPTS